MSRLHRYKLEKIGSCCEKQLQRCDVLKETLANENSCTTLAKKIYKDKN